MGREHDDHLLPHHPPLRVIDIMDLVEDHPLNVANDIGALCRRGKGGFGEGGQEP